MRSETIELREIPPPPPPRKTTFVYVAFLAGLSMLLVGGVIAVHVYLTKSWLAEIKQAAASRSLSAPPDVATSSESCPGDRPVLTGFGASGEPLCRAISGACADGQYIASIDPTTLEPVCASAGGVADCRGSYITEFMWLGEGHMSFTCHPRLDPFVAWKFTPVLGSRGSDR